MTKIKANIANKLIDELGNTYTSITALAKELGIWRGTISRSLKKHSYFKKDNHCYTCVDTFKELGPIIIEKEREDEDEYQRYLQLRDATITPVEIEEININSEVKGKKFVIALFSDAHIGKNIDSKTVNGLNEYNIDIANKRIETYFRNLVECLAKDEVDELIFASLGDGIDGFLRDEDLINSTATPLEQTMIYQNVLYNGLRYICNNPKLTKLKKIQFIGIPGNHSRATQKPMHNSSAFRMNYEVMAYQNVKRQCELTNLPIEFHIPESELYIMKIHNKTFGFAHGSFIRGGNSLLTGIYGPVLKIALKYKKLYNLDVLFMGHMHQTVYTTDAILNSSICGYDGFALANAFQYEPPQQSYICYAIKSGLQLLTRQIYCV
jgi:predicted phosphodiesterase